MFFLDKLLTLFELDSPFSGLLLSEVVWVRHLLIDVGVHIVGVRL